MYSEDNIVLPVLPLLLLSARIVCGENGTQLIIGLKRLRELTLIYTHRCMKRGQKMATQLSVLWLREDRRRVCKGILSDADGSQESAT